MAEELNMNYSVFALNGGEDYELLFTVPLDKHDEIEKMPDVKIIGHICEESKGKYTYSFLFNPLITIFPVPDLSQG